MHRQSIANNLTLLAVFLLPWQTRWIFGELTLAGEPWEYGKLSLYAVELVVIAAALARGRACTEMSQEIPLRSGLVFLAACFFSVSFAPNLTLSLNALLHVLCAFAFFHLLLDNRVSARALATAFLAGLLVPSVLGWVQVATGQSPSSSWLGLASHEATTLGASVVETASERVLRAYGTLSHPNVFGGFLAVGILVLAWLARQMRNRRERLWFILPVLVLVPTIIITFSRSAWLGTSLGFLILVILMLWHRKLPPHGAIPLAAVGLGAVFVTMLTFHSAIFTRFQPQVRLEAISIAERTSEYQWIDDIVYLRSHRWYPSATGVGPGAYTEALESVRQGDPVWSYQPIHNSFLLIFAEVGILGFLTFTWFFAAVGLVAYQARKYASGMFAIALGTTFLVVALLDHYAWTDWAGLGLSAVCFALILKWSEQKTL